MRHKFQGIDIASAEIGTTVGTSREESWRSRRARRFCSNGRFVSPSRTSNKRVFEKNCYESVENSYAKRRNIATRRFDISDTARACAIRCCHHWSARSLWQCHIVGRQWSVLRNQGSAWRRSRFARGNSPDSLWPVAGGVVRNGCGFALKQSYATHAV